MTLTKEEQRAATRALLKYIDMLMETMDAWQEFKGEEWMNEHPRTIRQKKEEIEAAEKVYKKILQTEVAPF